jgi:Tol biopolymer transport system component
MQSTVEIFELASGTSRPVFATDRLIEAPNWSPDGGFLIVNGDGRLWRLDLPEPRELVEIDTGFATRCNNDHGISPDGATIVISDATETGKSCIYTLPIGGGTPRRITERVPSYWHGWSPDGGTLAYCAERGGDWDIYTIGFEGGAETRLTDGQGASDGPDYSPDGEWIWFNSTRSGTMHLWRIRPDGSGLQQMTGDERVNWFPHPSPDDETVLYLAYGNGIEGHPRDKDVELRLMDADGGNIRTALALFGGQGSINVPCWAPDGRSFAFVRYARP